LALAAPELTPSAATAKDSKRISEINANTQTPVWPCLEVAMTDQRQTTGTRSSMAITAIAAGLLCILWIYDTAVSLCRRLPRRQRARPS
jgi:hypothetical protein